MSASSRSQPASIPFELVSNFEACGDQPSAIAKLNENLDHGVTHQTLLGVTGSGKTFTIANVIAKQNRPALIIAPNKTLAAQLYSEFKEFFPNNRVRYFISYYDYYQPEAYIPSSDTYIEKDSAINQEIDKMRHAATKSLLETTDCIIVASVSCIYGLGAPEEYFKMMLFLERGETIEREQVLRKLVSMQYARSEAEFTRGKFRVRGEIIDIFPADQDARAVRIVFYGDEIEQLIEIDSLSGASLRKLDICAIYPVSHFVTSTEATRSAIASIKSELFERLAQLRAENKLLEADRLARRTFYDLELLNEIGFCPGVENYSRHLAARKAGEPSTTLIDYFPDNFLLVIDESHVTLPQLAGMYRGDRSRKETLVNFGFRLPSALDNRPLKIEEFWQRTQQTIFVSATPSERELELSGGELIEQVNRPTGLLDPPVVIKPATNQVDDLIEEIRVVVARQERALVTTLTKKMSEELSAYLREVGIKCRYLHSEINAIERVEILRSLRQGEFDVLIGINLLREGLDLVEVSLVAILDADKEGFLRSTRSLIQTMGRAARNINGRVVLYADRITDSMRQAIDETERRREIQAAFNADHGIIPRSAKRSIESSLVETGLEVVVDEQIIEIPKEPAKQEALIIKLRADMLEAAAKRDYERAASLRDALKVVEEKLLMLGGEEQ